MNRDDLDDLFSEARHERNPPMISIRANTKPFDEAVLEIKSLSKRLDYTTRRHIFKLLYTLPEKLLVDFVCCPTANAYEQTIVAQPSQRFLSLLEALKASKIDLDRLDFILKA